MYRFVVRPRWMIGHILVICVVVGCALLSAWQFRRLDFKRDRIELVEAARALPEVPIGELTAPGQPTVGPSADAVAYRSVTVTGTYDLDHEVLIRNRPFQGLNGNDVVTPLVLADGSAVLVDRGWVPFDLPPGRPLSISLPPDGPITVTGELQRTERRGSVGPRDPAEGTLDELVRLDIDRLTQQLPYDVYPLYIQLATQSPPQPGDLPAVIEPETPNEGPHLSYALQWIIFGTLAVVIWVLVIRKAAHRPAPRPDGPTDPDGPASPSGPSDPNDPADQHPAPVP